VQAWDIKGQRAVIIREVKEHKKAGTCFALSETGENLLSGSADKSIRVTNKTAVLKPQRNINCWMLNYKIICRYGKWHSTSSSVLR